MVWGSIILPLLKLPLLNLFDTCTGQAFRLYKQLMVRAFLCVWLDGAVHMVLVAFGESGGCQQIRNKCGVQAIVISKLHLASFAVRRTNDNRYMYLGAKWWALEFTIS